MGVKFSVNKDSLERILVPEDMYTLEVQAFRPKLAKSGSSNNMNGQYKVVENPLYADKNIAIFDSLNSDFAVGVQDLTHACGFILDDAGNPPGDFEGPVGENGDLSKCKYVGPLLKRRFKAYLVLDSFDGKPSNKVKFYVCAVEDCASKYPKIKHSSNLLGNK